MLKQLLILTILFLSAGVVFYSGIFKHVFAQEPKTSHWWDVQAIDTVKTSRDLAREKHTDASFDVVINSQMLQISETGATHVSIGTPYDAEFLPYLKRWVTAARKYGLNVWFRGNFSGWEGWFGYKSITPAEHLQKTNLFIRDNAFLFEDGDIFTACPECENGGPGDPRLTGQAEEFREFLIDEYKITNEAFRQINKNVRTNFNSMNGDIARLIMDQETTLALGGIVTIDHYVATPQKLAADIKEIAKNSGGKVVLGEFGAPIPDIHGDLSDQKQANWVHDALDAIAFLPELYGVNYWTNIGSSTELWRSDNTARPVVDELVRVYTPHRVTGRVVNALGKPVAGAELNLGAREFATDEGGYFTAYFIDESPTFSITAHSYKEYAFLPGPDLEEHLVVLQKEHESLFFRLQKFFYRLNPSAYK